MDKYSVINSKKLAIWKYKSSQPAKPQNKPSQSITNKKLWSKLPFYNSSIEEPFSEPVTDKKLLSEMPFYESFLEEPIVTKKIEGF